MSTASKSPETTENREGHYAKFDEYVDFQISKTGSNIKANDLLTTGVGISTIFLGYLLIFVICDHWIIKGGFGHTSRLLMLAAVVLASLGWSVWKLVIPYFKKVTRLYSAHALEKTSDEMEGSLLNLIDLKKSNRSVNPEIINSLEKKAALTLSKTDTDLAVDRRPLMNLSYGLLIVVALLCFYALFSPKEIWPSVSAAMSFSPQREFATQTQINSVTPGNTEVLSGSQLEVIVDLRGEVPEKVMLFYTSSDQGRVDEPIALRSMDDTLKRYQGVIIGVNGRGIRQELTYHIEAGDAVSDTFKVKVIQPPSATVHSVRYEYPQYMGISDVEQPGGAIDAWEGTNVSINASTNMPITSFEVLFSDKEDSASLLEEYKVEKIIKNNSITASWKLKLRADGSSPQFYQIKCRNEAGQTTLSPTVYPLMIRPDLAPEITLLSPKQDLKMPANGIVPISVMAEDPDFKIRYLDLRVEKDQIRMLDKSLFEGAEKRVSLNQDFSLEPLRLSPGDTIYFWVEARDNKQPSGNRQNTPKIKIEILKPVSKEEAKKQLQEQKKKSEQEKQKQNPDPNNQSEKKSGKSSHTGGEDSKTKPDQSEKSKSGEGTKEENQTEKGTGENKQDKQGKPQQSEEPSTGQNQQKPGDKKGLDSGGKDDQEAIKKILEQLKKEGEEPKSDPKQKQPESEKPDSQNQSSDPKMQGQKSSNSSKDSTSQSSENPDGTPQDSENKNSKSQPSSKANQPDKDSSNQKPQKQTGPVPNGKKESAPPSDDATKTKSNEKTKGKGTPDHDPNAKPEKNSQNVQRDPNDKPATRPGKNDSSDSKPKQGEQPKNQNQSPEKPNSDSENKPQKRMRKSENSNQNPSPSQKQKPSDGNKKKQNNNQPDGANERPEGKNKPTDQKSKRPQDGDTGKSSQNDQGQSGSKQPGKGDSTGKKGNQEKGTEKKPSNSGQSAKQNNAQNKKSKGSSKNGQSGSQKQGSGEKGKGSESKGKSQSKSEETPGSGTSSKSDNPQGSSATRGGATPGEGNNPANAEGDHNLPEAEDANLEYGKEAANLVLKRIKDELKRKEVDQELLNELGWSKEEMKQFSERLQKQLQNPELNQQSPESLARKRQFEEMLKSLKPAPGAKQRNRTSTRKQTNNSLGPRRLPVPEEYREAYEAFTRGLAEKKPVNK
ncbi:hypothetical protein [uncultured Gimesia sp.]|uniref:hypothetical protein n=1 Tax=uncultured Gimesia sp. TaxID=1678688 RepID=UPI00260BB508|nr:hypothetical protein [uncultured Gimesia sp.]